MSRESQTKQKTRGVQTERTEIVSKDRSSNQENTKKKMKTWVTAPNSSMEIRWANAPISWGVNEFGIESGIKATDMLDELKMAGYHGTELGDHGFFPTDNAKLQSILKDRSLDMIGAFVCYSLWDRSTHAKGREYARKVAAQLKTFRGKQDYTPHIVLSDSVVDVQRIKNTGKITKTMSLKRKEWNILTQEIKDLKKLVKEEFGLECYYHPHCGSFVETPWEIEALCRDVPDLKLIFDTGHITMGASSKPLSAINLLKNNSDRIFSFHFKDYDSNVRGKDYFDLVQHGCFPELGMGIVDFEGVRDWQRQNNFKGWIVIEQDILGATKTSPLQSAIRNMAYLKGLYGEDEQESKL